MNLSIFESWNSQVNFLTVCIGLFISFLVPIVGFLLYGSVLVSGEGNITEWGYYFFLPSMALIGGLVASFLSSKSTKMGAINGALLGLIIVIIIGFIIGTILFGFILFLGAFNSAFPAYSPNTLVQSSLNQSTESIQQIKLILQPFVIILGGLIGGIVGYLIKKPFKKDK